MKVEVIHSTLCEILCDLCECLCDLCGKRQTLISLSASSKIRVKVFLFDIDYIYEQYYHLPQRAQRVTQSDTEYLSIKKIEKTIKVLSEKMVWNPFYSLFL